MWINNFSQNPFYRQLAILGFVSLSACVCPVSAAELGQQLGGNITLQDNDTIVYTSLSGNAAIEVNTAGNINLAKDVTITVNEGGTSGNGINVWTNGSGPVTVTADRLTINVLNPGGDGISIFDSANSSVDLGTDSIINVKQGTGINFFNAGATLRADKLTINAEKGNGIHFQMPGAFVDLGSGSVINSDYSGVRIGSSSGGPTTTLLADNLSINTKENMAYGIDIKKGAVVNLGSDSTITTLGDYAHGLNLFNGGTLEANALKIEVSGNRSAGILLDRSSNGQGSSINIGAGSSISSNNYYGIVVAGSDSIANYKGTASNRNTVTANDYVVTTAIANASLNLAYTDINVKSGWYGLYAQTGATISGDNIAINGGALGAYAIRDSQIDLTGDIAIKMETTHHYAILTKDDSADGYGASRVNADGKLTIEGSVFSKGGLVNLNMRPGSFWTGQSYSDNVNGGLLNVTMQDSRWNVTTTSKVDSLTLTNSIVDLVSSRSNSVLDTPELSSNGSNSVLYITDLNGSGTFIMRADIVGDGVNNSGDLIKVTGTSAGNHLLAIKNQGSLASTGNEVLTVVETTDGVATFETTTEVELGGYLYDVRQNGTNWELYSSSIYPNPTPDTDSGSTTTTADAGGNYLNVGYLMNYVESQTLMQRMGDLRQSDEHGNIWLRGYGGKFDSFANGKLSGFDMSYTGIQFGADKRISAETPLFIGLFMGSTHASPDYRGGDGTARSDYAGMYASYMAQSGFYSDLVVKASRQKNSFNVLDSQNNSVNANSSSSGFSASLEAGQKFSLSQPGNGFYIEPQAQFTYSHQNAMNMQASNGLNINLSSYESMLGRASVLLGYETTTGNSKLNIYLKTGGIREFSGNTDYRLNSAKETHSFKGNGWNSSLGISTQVNKQHMLYLEADYTRGNAFNQKQVNCGYRFSF